MMAPTAELGPLTRVPQHIIHQPYQPRRPFYDPPLPAIVYFDVTRAGELQSLSSCLCYRINSNRES